MPIFDNCPDPTEISVFGGGCQQVGVTACATGLFSSDGEGGCEPILPPGPTPCPAGTMEILGQTSCQPVGVSRCGDGFQTDDEGGCEPILPPASCPLGTIAVIGESSCQPLGDCGTTTWGSIALDPTTLYVDQSADATGADGTATAPFPTIGEALAVVDPGGQIAIAAGDYLERLNVNLEVRLAGRCAERVTIRGQVFLGQPRAPVALLSGGTGSTLSGVALTGPGEGLAIDGAQQVTIEDVQVTATGLYGISLSGGAEVDLHRVKVTGCAQAGIYSEASALTLNETVVRDTVGQQSDGRFGRGINAGCSSAGSCGRLEVTRSLLEGNRDSGVGTFGVAATLTDTVVRTTQPQQSDSTGGMGVAAWCHSSGPCGSLNLSGCVIAENRGAGILASGVETAVTDTVVRDTRSLVAGSEGRGVNADCSPSGTCAALDVSDSVIRGNRDGGIVAYGVPLTVVGTIVRDTGTNATGGTAGQYGHAIYALCDDTLGACGSFQVVNSLLDTSACTGLAVKGLSGFVSASAIRNVSPQPADGSFGFGIQIVGIADQVGPAMPSFNILGCEILDASLAGVFYYQARGTLSGSVVSGAENSVLMNQGSDPLILDDNELSGTVKDEPTWANLDPSPSPPPALPHQPTE
ncbi:MAG: right-handed parallel beta-helix repeat-containing protein [bacterium]